MPAVCSSADQVPADTWDAVGLVPADMPVVAGSWSADMYAAGLTPADMYAAAGSSVDDISAVAAAP